MKKRHATVILLVGGAAFVAMFAPPVVAHAVYESSNPPDGGTVSSPPSQVSAEFSEPLIPDSSSMDVTDPCGRGVGGGTTVVGETMTVSMSGGAKGTYVVSWRAHSSVDGHVTEGDFSFTSTGGEPCPGEEEPKEEQPQEEQERDAGSGSDPSGGEQPSGGGGSDSGSDDNTARDGNVRGDGRDGSANGGDKRGSRNNEKSDASSDSSSNVAAPVPVAEESKMPSALEGLPIDGVIMTLLVSALIGAAGGKIYVSLSDDE